MSKRIPKYAWVPTPSTRPEPRACREEDKVGPDTWILEADESVGREEAVEVTIRCRNCGLAWVKDLGRDIGKETEKRAAAASRVAEEIFAKHIREQRWQ
jgi:hypothetical protein